MIRTFSYISYCEVRGAHYTSNDLFE